MRSTNRLLAIIYKNAPLPKGSTAYLNAHQPTGLTGILTHPYPRPILIHLYTQTLQTLSQFPAHSVYRQATEALTKQRLSVIESTLPPGYAEWQTRTAELLEQNPELGSEGRGFKTLDGKTYILPDEQESSDDRVEEWDGESMATGRGEGPRSEEERRAQAREFGEGRKADAANRKDVTIVNEPPLTADQVDVIEKQIGAGLIEEIVAVAEGELKLVNSMLEHKVWEELEEKPVQGQWDYQARDRHVGITQAP